MRPYRLTTEAQNDVKEIARYIEANAGVERAIDVISTIRGEFLKIGKWPGRGHFREDLAGKEIKFWSIYNYLIAYRWEQKPIQIVAVVHGARDLPNFFQDRL